MINTAEADGMELEVDGEVARWCKALARSRRKEKDWRKTARECWDIFLSRKEAVEDFNIFHSNVETLLPAVFNSIPNPDVRQRNKDHDPVARQLAEVTERALVYTMDNGHYDFERTIELCLLDYLVAGRGVVYVDYEPVYKTVPQEVLGPDGSIEVVEQQQLTGERVYCQHTPWDRVIVHQAPKWSAVEWVAFESFPTKTQVRAMFPDLPKGTQFISPENPDDRKQQYSDSYGEGGLEAQHTGLSDLKDRLQLFKIWDKTKRQVIYISPGVPERVLGVEEDPFNLPGFFPMPQPIQTKLGTSDMVPACEYEFYKKQAEELNKISARITVLVSGLKFKGVFSAVVEEMGNLAAAKDYEFVAVSNNVLSESRIDSLIWTMPVERIAQVLASLYQQRDQIISVIYQITGISDILRGQTDASETATAQNIKAQYGSLRIDRRRREVARFIRDILRIKASIIEQFEPQSIEQMTGITLAPEVLGLLQQQGLSSYKIDIETDSTVAANQADDQKAMTDLLTGIVQYMQGMAPLVQTGAIPIEAAKEILLAAVRRMRLGRAVEDALDLIGLQVATPPPGIPLPGELPIDPAALQAPQTVQVQ